ncbi:MAG: hypothetical protein GOMPHAMPRED_001529 [Gomphillus americanus]|uniref:WIBG Mago-binding domain-containing protein n=1 Tax=Gomphillus americanus TaxID=1940652 RepID=A0A8H3FAH3_9LECA|nr:MAG: hypothetical protein GOMPHAMPRED_001529 [Gomphillus americanus]
MAAKVDDSTSATNSGIITDTETGQRHIPSSVRADGSKRKEIKIRPGYRPPEDVEVYKNRTAHAFKTRGIGGIPGAEGLEDDNGGGNEKGKTSKNAKKREARKRGQPEKIIGEDEEGDILPTDQAVVNNAADNEVESTLSKEEQESIEREKKARKLKKKLREAKELQQKKEKGEKLLHEQLEKVIKINELVRDLDKLGFDANGEPKTEANDG